MYPARGIRNFNPGNIEHNPANKWQGRMPRAQMTPAQRAEKRFEVFKSPVWGIRAMCKLLINYQDFHGCDTVAKVINRWAPSTENNTTAYINAVATRMGVHPHEPINLHQYAMLHPCVLAIIQHENGKQPYNAAIIEEGLRLAGVVKPRHALVSEPKAATRATTVATTVGTAAAVAEGVRQVMPLVNTANEVNYATQGMPQWLRTGVVVLIAVSVGFSWYATKRLRDASKAVKP